MKIKTSITLSEDVISAIDTLTGDSSRSEVIERILRNHIGRRQRALARERELAGLNRLADRLNAEGADTLEYQQEWSPE